MSYQLAFDWASNHASNHSLTFSIHDFIGRFQEISPRRKHKSYPQVHLPGYLKCYLPNLQ